MARTMTTLARRYPAKTDAVSQTPPLPVTLDVRLGLDVAASDNQPLVVVLARDATARAALAANASASIHVRSASSRAIAWKQRDMAAICRSWTAKRKAQLRNKSIASRKMGA